MKIIKTYLRISNMEDYFNKKLLIDIIIISMLALFQLDIGNSNYYSKQLIAFLLVSVFSYQFVTLIYRKRSDFIFITSKIKAIDKLSIFLLGASLQNILYLFFIITNLLLLKFDIISAVLLGILYYIYFVSIGILLGFIFKSTIGLSIIFSIHLLFLVNNKWTNNENFRLISPMTQLHNPTILENSNICSIAILTITFILLIFIYLWEEAPLKKIKYNLVVLTLSFISFFCIVVYELNYNKISLESKIIEEKFSFSSKIREDDAYKLRNILSTFENEFVEKGIISNISSYQINKYYTNTFLDSLYKTRRIPFEKKDNIFYMNIYSNAMLNFNDIGIANDIIDRILMHILDNKNKDYYIEQIGIYVFNEYIYEELKSSTYLSNEEKNAIIPMSSDEKIVEVLSYLDNIETNGLKRLYENLIKQKVVDNEKFEDILKDIINNKNVIDKFLAEEQ